MHIEISDLEMIAYGIVNDSAQLVKLKNFETDRLEFLYTNEILGVDLLYMCSGTGFVKICSLDWWITFDFFQDAMAYEPSLRRPGAGYYGGWGYMRNALFWGSDEAFWRFMTGARLLLHGDRVRHPGSVGFLHVRSWDIAAPTEACDQTAQT